MTKRLTLFCYVIFLSIFQIHSAPSREGEESSLWQVYPAYNVCTQNIPVGTRIYALMESKLMAYDTEDHTITTFDWTRQLNDVAIAFIHYSADAGRLILVYDNGNIDLLSTTDDDDVINLAQLKNSTLQNKSINNVQVDGSTAYVCTGFGIVVVDMSKGIIQETYNLGLNVLSCASNATTLYAGTSTGLWTGQLADNLQDKTMGKQFNTNYKATHMSASMVVYGHTSEDGFSSLIPKASTFLLRSKTISDN